MTREFETQCTFRVGADRFGIPVERIQEVLHGAELTPVPLAPHAILGLLNLRGQIVTAVSLRRCVGLPDTEPSRAPLHVLVRHAGDLVTLVVDEIGDVTPLTSGQVESCPDTLRGAVREWIRYVAKLDDGIVLVLDLDRVLQGALA
jgi:purine-binding chemotaxis protein CheW